MSQACSLTSHPLLFGGLMQELGQQKAGKIAPFWYETGLARRPEAAVNRHLFRINPTAAPPARPGMA
jgi:hypothetical protein